MWGAPLVWLVIFTLSGCVYAIQRHLEASGPASPVSPPEREPSDVERDEESDLQEDRQMRWLWGE